MSNKGTYSYVWDQRVLDVRYVETNDPKVVAQRILSMEKQIDQLNFVYALLEIAYDRLVEKNNKDN